MVIDKKILNQFKSGVLISFGSKIFSFFITFILLIKLGTSIHLDIFITVSSFVMVVDVILNKIYMNIVPNFYFSLKINEERITFINSLFVSSIIITFITFVVFVLFSEFIIAFIAPGFSKEELFEGAKILRVFSITLNFNIISSLFLAYLRTIENTNPIYIREIIINFIVLLLISVFDFNIDHLVLFYIVAYLFSFIYLLKVFPVKQFILYKSTYTKTISYFRQFIVLSIPIFLTTTANEIKNIIDKVFASFLDNGSITALNFSYRIIGLPVNILGGVLVTIIYTRLVKNSKKEEFYANIIELTSLVLLVTIPISLFVYIKSELVALIFTSFSNGIKFDLLNLTLRGYSFCIIGNALLLLMTTVYYAKGEAMKNLKIAISVTIMNVLFNYLLITNYAASGLAFSTSIASLVSYFYSLLLFNSINRKTYIKSIFKRIYSIIILLIPSILFLNINIDLHYIESEILKNFFMVLIYSVGFIGINYFAFIKTNKYKEIMKFEF